MNESDVGESSTSQNIFEPKYCFKPNTAYAIIASILFLVITGVFNNCLIVAIVWRTKSMQTPTNLLLSNNAITETTLLLASGCELVLRISTLSDISLALPLSVNSSDVRSSLLLLMIVSYLVAGTNITLLAVQRYNALWNPMKVHRRLGQRNTKIFILAVWCLAVLLILPAIVKRNFDGRPAFDPSSYIYFSTLAAICSLTTGCSILYCYGTIVYGVYVSKTILSRTCGAALSEDLKAKRNIVKMLISIAVSFFATKFTLVVYIAVIIALQERDICFFSLFIRTLAIASAFLNPVINLILNINYRQGALRLLRSCRCRKNRVDSRQEITVIPKQPNCEKRNC